MQVWPHPLVQPGEENLAGVTSHLHGCTLALHHCPKKAEAAMVSLSFNKVFSVFCIKHGFEITWRKLESHIREIITGVLGFGAGFCVFAHQHVYSFT